MGKLSLTQEQIEKIIGKCPAHAGTLDIRQLTVDLNDAFRPQGLAFQVGKDNTKLTVSTTLDGEVVSFQINHRW